VATDLVGHNLVPIFRVEPAIAAAATVTTETVSNSR
jgi:hypothetical protein